MMYVHKKCVSDEMDIDDEKVAYGYCARCSKLGSIYHVRGADDYYRTKRQGVTLEVMDGHEVFGVVTSSDKKIDDVPVPSQKEQEVAESIPDTDGDLDPDFKMDERLDFDTSDIEEPVEKSAPVDEIKILEGHPQKIGELAKLTAKQAEIDALRARLAELEAKK